MYKKQLRVTILVLLIFSIVSGSLFAAGKKEAAPNSFLVRVMNVLSLEGTPAFSVKDDDGFEQLLHAGIFTDTNFPLADITVGDYLEVVVDNSIIHSMRYVNPIIKENRIPLSSAMDEMSLEDRFSYTYGYQLMQMFAQQGLFLDPNYWARGSIDGIHDMTNPDSIGFYEFTYLFDVINQFQSEIWEAGTAPTSYPDVMSLKEVANLTADDDLLKKFSYTYGYLLVSDLLNLNLDANSELYAQGGLDFAGAATPMLDEFAMQMTFYEYQMILEEQYQAEMAVLAQRNLEEAESFLAMNANKEGVVTTETGLQYTILEEGSGPKPTLEDQVEVHYTLYLINGQILESSKDSGQSVHFSTSNLIEGFTEALLAMNVGSKVRTWIHPALGYGEYGSQAIEPNTLLIFEIELLGIDE